MLVVMCLSLGASAQLLIAWISGLLGVRIVGRQVPKPWCLNPAADSLDFRIAGRQVPKPRCLSSVVNSLDFRTAGRQVPKPRCLSPVVNSLDFRIAVVRCLSLGA